MKKLPAYRRSIQPLLQRLAGREPWLLLIQTFSGVLLLLPAAYWLGSEGSERGNSLWEGAKGIGAEIYRGWLEDGSLLWRLGLSLPGLLLLSLGLAMTLRHFVQLEKLRRQMLLHSLEPTDVLPPREPQSFDSVGRFHNSLSGILARRREQYQQLESDLSAVLSAIGEAVVVIVPDGRVSMFNQAAIESLGEQNLKIGYTIFGALRRSILARALEQLQNGSRMRLETELRTSSDLPVFATIARLEDKRGFVISLATRQEEQEAEELTNQESTNQKPKHPEPTHQQSTHQKRQKRYGRLTHQWILHERLPRLVAPHKATPLSELPVSVIDTETTGLNAPNEAVIAFGGVRMLGSRIYFGETIEQNILPDLPLNPESIKIHGLTEEMLEKEPPIGAAWPRLQEFLSQSLLVGHNIGFDLLILTHHLKRNGIEWKPPLSLDTVLLAAALDPTQLNLELEALAELYGVPILGRHTALGDALMTANLFARLLLCFRDNGLESLGDLLKNHNSRSALLKEQRREGWLLPG